jgi:hypothetical protein
MDRGVVLLQGLRDKLNTGWARTIQRSTGASSVSFVERTNGEFALRVVWKNGDIEKVFEKEFTRASVLGASVHRSTLEWHVQKRTCDYARDTIREVLAVRGVL